MKQRRCVSVGGSGGRTKIDASSAELIYTKWKNQRFMNRVTLLICCSTEMVSISKENGFACGTQSFNRK